MGTTRVPLMFSMRQFGKKFWFLQNFEEKRSFVVLEFKFIGELFFGGKGSVFDSFWSGFCLHSESSRSASRVAWDNPKSSPKLTLCG